jgi:PEP-CTERM motif
MIGQIALASIVAFTGLVASSDVRASVTYSAELKGTLYYPDPADLSVESSFPYDVVLSYATSNFITADTPVLNLQTTNPTCTDKGSAEFCDVIIFKPSVATASGPMVEVDAAFLVATDPGLFVSAFFPLGSLGTDGTLVSNIGSGRIPDVHILSDIASTSLSVVSSGSAVPEPASWALMIAGFAGLGAAALRRRVFRLSSMRMLAR